MTYGAPASSMLPPYVQAGMRANTVVKGYQAGMENPQSDVQWIVANGYGGVMIFTLDASGGASLMGELVDAMSGAGNWTLDPNCGSVKRADSVPDCAGSVPGAQSFGSEPHH